MKLSFEEVNAIYELNPSIVTLRGKVAYDVNEQIVDYDFQAAVTYAKSQEYKAKRASEYPPITDYLDGVVKGDQAQIDAYIAACQAVKAKYPKEQA